LTSGVLYRDYSAMAFAPASSKGVVAAELYPEGDRLWILAADPRQPAEPLCRQLDIPSSRLSMAADLISRCELTSLAQDMISQLCSDIATPLFTLADNPSALVIAPHGPLHLLPIQAGEVGGGRVLAECLPVTVLPSTSFTAIVARDRHTPLLRSVTLLKGPDNGFGKSAEHVGEALKRMFLNQFPALPFKVTEQPRKLSSGDALIVVAHGRPSELLLKNRSGEPAWIGAQRLAEALGRPSLTFLAVCRSSTAEVAVDEEPLGLAWPLMAGGTRAVVAGLWDVEVKAAASFISTLIGELLHGRTLGESFSTAVSAQRSGQFHDFRDWAAFVLSGDWRLRLTL
jgi:hypothetical protein